MLTVSETAELLRSFDRVLILTHIRPDGDTVGCAAGLCAALRALGKTAFLLPNPGLTDTTAPILRPMPPRRSLRRQRRFPWTLPRWGCSPTTPSPISAP